jgi:cysteinyl-tRNA synthetase
MLAADHEAFEGKPCEPDEGVVDALADDLNTSLALTRLMELARLANNPNTADAAQLELRKRFVASAELLGFDLYKLTKDWLKKSNSLEFLAKKLAALRETAMVAKDFAPVDAMKAALVAAGVEVRMSKAGVELLPGPGFDAAKLEGLV